jgi:hypothetical protein
MYHVMHVGARGGCWELKATIDGLAPFPQQPDVDVVVTGSGILPFVRQRRHYLVIVISKRVIMCSFRFYFYCIVVNAVTLARLQCQVRGGFLRVLRRATGVCGVKTKNASTHAHGPTTSYLQSSQLAGKYSLHQQLDRAFLPSTRRRRGFHAPVTLVRVFRNPVFSF